ncbi:MAG: hypothetical protein MZV65_19870 [Chromatiales bacterium]|nr:hypothetical protein [Chromatiales bacterium]
MGANHPGEIAYLTAHRRARMSAIITNAGPLPSGGLRRSWPAWRTAKGEIFQGLGPDGVAVDQPRRSASRDYWRGLNPGRADRGLRTAIAGHGAAVGCSMPATNHVAADAPAAGKSTIRLPLPGGTTSATRWRPRRRRWRSASTLDDVRQGLGGTAAASAAGCRRLHRPARRRGDRRQPTTPIPASLRGGRCRRSAPSRPAQVAGAGRHARTGRRRRVDLHARVRAATRSARASTRLYALGRAQPAAAPAFGTRRAGISTTWTRCVADAEPAISSASGEPPIGAGQGLARRCGWNGWSRRCVDAGGTVRGLGGTC